VSPSTPNSNLTTEENPIDVGQVASVHGEALNLSITAEARTQAIIEVTADNYRIGLPKSSVGRSIGDNGSLVINDLIGGKMICDGVTYNVKVSIIDRAGNVSEVVSLSKKSKECPRCGGFGGNFNGTVVSNPSDGRYSYPNWYGSPVVWQLSAFMASVKLSKTRSAQIKSQSR
jgi:hypothetical protein